MKKNLTMQECETLYPYADKYAMVGSQDLRAKLAKQIKNFSKHSKPIINIDVDTFGILQAILRTLNEQIMPWLTSETKHFGMTIRFSDLLLNDGKKTEHAEASITADIPHYLRNTAFKVVRVISSNMFVTSAIPSNKYDTTSSCYKSLDVGIFKKPNFMAMATGADVPPDHTITRETFPMYWLPFNEDAEIDKADSSFYKFCHSAPSLALCKSLGEISILISAMLYMLPDEFSDQIFEKMPDDSFTLHFPDDKMGAEIIPYIVHALTEDVRIGFISDLPILDRLIDDEITLDETGVDKLISLWRGDEYKNVPADLVHDKIIPMIGCAIKYNNKTYKIVTRMVDFDEDNDEFYISESDDDDETSSAGYLEVRYSNGYTAIKKIRYADNRKWLYMIDAGIDEEDSNKVLKAWYGIQLSLMHPIIKAGVEKHCRLDSMPATESTNQTHIKKEKTERYIRHYYKITGDDFTKILTDKYHCRHNHRYAMSWYVIGHWRKYKNGHQTFIKGYWKGPLKDVYSTEARRKRDIDM